MYVNAVFKILDSNRDVASYREKCVSIGDWAKLPRMEEILRDVESARRCVQEGNTVVIEYTVDDQPRCRNSLVPSIHDVEFVSNIKRFLRGLGLVSVVGAVVGVGYCVLKLMSYLSGIDVSNLAMGALILLLTGAAVWVLGGVFEKDQG